jgi:hypothetical protein
MELNRLGKGGRVLRAAARRERRARRMKWSASEGALVLLHHGSGMPGAWR